MTEEPADDEAVEGSPDEDAVEEESATDGESDVDAARAELEAVDDPSAVGQSANEPPDETDPDGDDGEDVTHAEDLVHDPEEDDLSERARASPVGDDADVAAATDAAEATESDADDVDNDGTAEADAAAAGADGDDEAGDAAEADDDAAVATATGDGQTAAAAAAGEGDGTGPDDEETDHQPGVPADVRKYDRFKKVDGAQYDRVNEFLRDRTYVTAREWAIARLCSDFRTETGVEMTKIGENLPELVPFMTDTYTAQAVNQARSSFEDKVRTAGATFLYGAMCDFFTAEELDDVMYEATEVAKFLLEVEGVELSVEEELEAEDRISTVMREVRESSAELRHESCPECGHRLTGDD